MYHCQKFFQNRAKVLFLSATEADSSPESGTSAECLGFSGYILLQCPVQSHLQTSEYASQGGPTQPYQPMPRSFRSRA